MNYVCILYLLIPGEDCNTCGPKVTSSDDVADVDIPEWKKKALKEGLDANAAPFGMNDWNMEASTSATSASAAKGADESAAADGGHSHEHSHGHSHGHS